MLLETLFLGFCVWATEPDMRRNRPPLYCDRLSLSKKFETDRECHQAGGAIMGDTFKVHQPDGKVVHARMVRFICIPTRDA